ncbi:MAG: ArsC family reductase [Burkholderiales bacterium]|nr:ArsC family reductase [Burkholderiales bacterium]
MITLYGVPQCDTVKAARAWLSAQNAPQAFHDYKKQGVPAARLNAWVAGIGWETLLNRRGTTWRRLDPAQQVLVVDAASAVALMLKEPSLIRRPVVEWPDGQVSVGFSASDWAGRLRAA